MDDQFQKYRTADIWRSAKPPLKTIVYYPQETFATCPLFPTYWVGNFGTIYNMSTNLRVNYYIGTTGYAMTSMRMAFDNQYHTIGVHRAIMLTHAPIQNANEMQVNHLDGCKYHNIYLPGSPLNNLEWVTAQQNVQHAFDNGFHKILVGEEAGAFVYTEDQAVAVCLALSNGATIPEAVAAAGLEYNKRTKTFVEHIKYGEAWTYISQNFDIPQAVANDHHTEPEVHLICQYIEKGLSDSEVSQAMANHGYHVKPGFVSSIRGHDRPWAHISRQYNFQYRQKPFKLTDEKKHQFCQYVEMGYTYTQIQQLMGLYDTPAKTLASLISGLKKGNIKSWLPISSQYNLNRSVEPFYPSQQLAAEIMRLAAEGATITDIARTFNLDIKAFNTWLYSGARRRADYVVPRVV